MKILRRIAASALTLLLCGAVPALAQEACESQTILDVWNSVSVQQNIAEDLQKNDTGADPGNVESDASKKSFLPLLRFAFNQLGFLSEDQNSFSFSQKIPLGSRPLQINVQGKVQEPEIFDGLKELLPEEGRQDRIDELLADLDESDDFTLTLSSNLLSKHLGRAVGAYGLLLNDVVSGIEAEGEAGEEELLALASLIQRITNELKMEIDEETDLCTLSESNRQQIREQVLLAARADVGFSETLAAQLESTGLSQFYKLVDNQPQLHLTAAYRWRNELLGPSGLTAKLTYEHGFANVNQLRRKFGDGGVSLTEYSAYLKDPRTKALLERDDRITFTAEYQDDEEDQIVLADDEIDLEIGTGTTLKATLAYGRSLNIAPDSQVLSRVDLAASYEDVDSDPLRQDRGVGSITYTARVRNPWFFTVVFNYANHAKYLPESDEDFGAHVGISYNLFSKQADQ